MRIRWQRQVLVAAIAMVLGVTSKADELDSLAAREHCGSQFSTMRKQLDAAGFPARAVKVITDNALSAYQMGLQQRGASGASSTSQAFQLELKQKLEEDLSTYILQQGSLLDVVACWYSQHHLSEREFQDITDLIQHLDSSDFGNQPLNYLAAVWCGRNWETIRQSLNRRLSTPLPEFLPFPYCIRPQTAIHFDPPAL